MAAATSAAAPGTSTWQPYMVVAYIPECAYDEVHDLCKHEHNLKLDFAHDSTDSRLVDMENWIAHWEKLLNAHVQGKLKMLRQAGVNEIQVIYFEGGPCAANERDRLLSVATTVHFNAYYKDRAMKEGVLISIVPFKGPSTLKRYYNSVWPQEQARRYRPFALVLPLIPAVCDDVIKFVEKLSDSKSKISVMLHDISSNDLKTH